MVLKKPEQEHFESATNRESSGKYFNLILRASEANASPFSLNLYFSSLTNTIVLPLWLKFLQNVRISTEYLCNLA